MADNFTTPVPDATTLATKDISGVHYPKNLIAKWDGTDADLATQTTLAAINAKLNASVSVTQSGSWNVGVTGSVAVTGTFWQATQPVSVASLPLPTGAATAAKQPAPGVAGSASSDVITIQGIASMTAVKVDGSGFTQPVSGTVSINNAGITDVTAGDYETVAASQTDQMCGGAGAAGDYLAGVVIIPATTSPGAVSIEDGSTNTTIFTGGASSVSNLVPFIVPLGIRSASGGWEITTGANVSAIAVGNFT